MVQVLSSVKKRLLELKPFSGDGTAKVWEGAEGWNKFELKKTLQHNEAVYNAQFNHDGTKVVTASGDGTAQVWDANTGNPLTEPLIMPRSNGGAVNFAQFSPDNKHIVTTAINDFYKTNNNQALIWDIAIQPASKDNQLIASLAEAVAGFEIDPNGNATPIKNRFDKIKSLQDSTSKAAPENEEKWFVHWFLKDRWNRTISPNSKIEVAYIQTRMNEEHIQDASVLFGGKQEWMIPVNIPVPAVAATPPKPPRAPLPPKKPKDETTSPHKPVAKTTEEKSKRIPSSKHSPINNWSIEKLDKFN